MRALRTSSRDSLLSGQCCGCASWLHCTSTVAFGFGLLPSTVRSSREEQVKPESDAPGRQDSTYDTIYDLRHRWVAVFRISERDRPFSEPLPISDDT
jgi:hypothetical protein